MLLGHTLTKPFEKTQFQTALIKTITFSKSTISKNSNKLTLNIIDAVKSKST